MTFIEAYELYGRDSMAIAEATGLSEAEAYNAMAARANIDHGAFPTEESIQEYRRASMEIGRQRIEAEWRAQA